MTDNYIYVIVALLPLAALMLVFQANPYHALVIRAILGAVAALVYAVLGAADVALTEALVGTMLAITLYVVAVRSSLVMRLGILKETEAEKESYFKELIANLRKVVNKHHLRLELVVYPNIQALERALMAKEVHATCTKAERLELNSDRSLANTPVEKAIASSQPVLFPVEIRANKVVEETGDLPSHSEKVSPYHTTIRVRRLFEIMQTEAHLLETILSYVTVSNVENQH